ncbi:MAG TPA: TolC family protein, partial [Thermoanaerobaculia bacterium]|nr:TolC family protein [Thermoanaerobaculia bacterium]
MSKFFIAMIVAFGGACALAAQERAQEMPQEPASSGRTLVLSLEDALSIALGESETIWVAEAGVMRAVGNTRIARSGFFPQVSGTATYTRTLASQFEDIDFGGGGGGGGEVPEEDLGDLPFGQVNQYTLGLTLNQLVFDAGQTGARNRAALARRRSAEIDVVAARAQTLLDVTQRYFDAQLSDRLVEIAQGSLAQTEEVLRQTDVARRVGAQSEFELLRARVARDNQVPVLLRRRIERLGAYLRLKQLLNVPLDDELQLTTQVEDLPARFATRSDLSADQRAPVRQAVENITATREQLTETRGQRWPAVSLSSRYAPVAFPASGFPEPGDFRNDWTVSLNLSVPILTWGRLRGNEMVAEGNLSQAEAVFQQTREAAELDARLAQTNLANAEATLQANTSTVQEATRAYEIAQLRYREGISSQIELTDSRLLFEQAEVNRAQALRDVQVARARLALLADLPLGTAIQGSGGATPQQFPQQTPTTQ